MRKLRRIWAALLDKLLGEEEEWVGIVTWWKHNRKDYAVRARSRSKAWQKVFEAAEADHEYPYVNEIRRRQPWRRGL